MGEVGPTSGDTDGDVGQGGDPIRGPGEEASDDLHCPSPPWCRRGERGKAVFSVACPCLPSPKKINEYYF